MSEGPIEVLAHEVRSPVAALAAIAEAYPAADESRRRRLLELAAAAVAGIERLLVDAAPASMVRVAFDASGLVQDAVDAADQNMTAATIIGAIAIAIVLFIAYFAGGYVAGRMARLSGAKQGLAVWLWAIAIAILVAVVTAIAGSQWDILANVDIFPRIPVTADTATWTGILTAIGAAVITLIAAILGGAAGMRYHRRVDRAGFGDDRV